MTRSLVVLSLSSLLLCPAGCGTSGGATKGGAFKPAVDELTQGIYQRLPPAKKTSVAIVGFSAVDRADAQGDAFSRYLVEELTTRLVNDGRVKVAARAQLERNVSKFQSQLKIRENNLFFENFRKFRLPYSLYFPANSFTAKPDATVIAETVKEKIPAVVIRNSQEHNSALLAGWNYINWRLNPSSQENDYFQSLIASLLSGIIKENKKDILRIRTNKTYYAVSEPVRIEIFKDFPESETGIKISAAIISADKRTPLELKPMYQKTHFREITSLKEQAILKSKLTH